MALSSDRTQREVDKFVQNANGDTAVRVADPYARWSSNLIRKTVAFDGTAGNGATGTVALLTVTGTVLVWGFATCSEDLASAGGGSIAIGTSGITTSLITTTTATSIDNGMVWQDASPSPGSEIVIFASDRGVLVRANVLATVATSAITNGTINFYFFWIPLSSNGNVVTA